MNDSSKDQTETLMSVCGLTKRYGDMTAVDNVSFDIGTGEVVGFLGPNGAGKTTTMRMLTTYLPPTEGSAQVCGADVLDQSADVRKVIGYLPESPPLYNEMRIEDYLRFVAEIKGVQKALRKQRIDWSLESCGLIERRRQIIGTLSKGFKQRVGIAQAIIHDPKVLILDEPSSGLDPNQIVEIRKLIRQLGADRTVLLSTHILQEVASVCDRALIMHQGKLVHDAAIGTGEDDTYKIQVVDIGRPLTLPDVVALDIQDKGAGQYTVRLADDGNPDALLKAIIETGLGVKSFAPTDADLERVFMTLTSTEVEREAA